MALKVKFNPSEPGFWVSGVAHVALIAAAMVGLSSVSEFPEAQEGIPVEIITDNQFSQITKGETPAKSVQPMPKPRVDRVADKSELRDPGEDKRDAPSPPKRPEEMKVAEKEEPVPAQPAPPPPPPSRAEAEAKAAEAAKQAAEAKAAEDAKRLAEEKAEAEAIERAKVAEAKAKAEAEAKAKAEAEAKAKAEAEARRIAEAKAKEKAEAEAKAKAEAEAKKVAEAKAKEKAEAEAKARKEAQIAKKLDMGDLKQFLDNKEKHQSSGATGAEVQKTASLGTATGSAAKLSPSMRDSLIGLLQSQIQQCYSAPVSAMGGNVESPVIDIRLNQDGSLARDPSVLRAGSGSADRATGEAILRAIRRCAPFRIPAQFAGFYTEWKALNVTFDLS